MAPPSDLDEAFRADPVRAVEQVLRQADKELRKADILDILVVEGVGRDAAEASWRRVQAHLRRHEQIVIENNRYRWGSRPSLSATAAFDHIVAGRLPSAVRDAHVAVVRDALRESSQMRGQLRDLEVDAAKALADMAMEVEELAAKGASPEAIIRNVRARMKRLRLQPIERAGAEVDFDPRRHRPIHPTIPEGARVVVVRPGYVWQADSDIIIERPLVQD